jgi:hypothetical protein
MKRVRITGLVKIADGLRRELSSPMPQSRLRSWRKAVSDAVETTDQILRNAGAPPSSLPPPSLRAYHFLKSVDWAAVRVGDEDAGPLEGLRADFGFRGLSAVLERNLDRLARATTDQDLDRAHHSILTTSRHIEGAISRNGVTPDQLSDATRAARGWLAFFAERDNLTASAQAMRLASPLLIPAARQARFSGDVLLHFRPLRELYRLRQGRGGCLLAMPTPMISLDPAGFQTLADLIAGRCREAKHRLVEEMMKEPYQLTHAELESLGGLVERTRGVFHDLAESFTRVNTRFFGGLMPRPRLTWSRAFTGRKFGHYDYVRDTVMLSATLDQSGVEQFVVDFVMYHELLHKHLGVRVMEGRRYAHTPEFRAAERAFPRHPEAEAVLERLACQAGSP